MTPTRKSGSEQIDETKWRGTFTRFLRRAAVSGRRRKARKSTILSLRPHPEVISILIRRSGRKSRAAWKLGRHRRRRIFAAMLSTSRIMHFQTICDNTTRSASLTVAQAARQAGRACAPRPLRNALITYLRGGDRRLLSTAIRGSALQICCSQAPNCS